VVSGQWSGEYYEVHPRSAHFSLLHVYVHVCGIKSTLIVDGAQKCSNYVFSLSCYLEPLCLWFPLNV